MKFKDLKVGMKVLIKPDSEAVSPIVSEETKALVAEIVGNAVFLHSNNPELMGSIGKVKPQVNDYEYSWCVLETEENVLESIEIIPDEKEVGSSEVKKPKKLNLMRLSFERENAKIHFSFELDKKLTDIFKEMSEEIKTSESWKGLKFYYIPSLTTQSSYKSMLRSYNLFDDFGQPLYKDGLFNIAWIRTVTGSGKIQVKEALNEEEFKSFLRNAVGFLRAYYEGALRDTKLTATLELEI